MKTQLQLDFFSSAPPMGVRRVVKVLSCICRQVCGCQSDVGARKCKIESCGRWQYLIINHVGAYNINMIMWVSYFITLAGMWVSEFANILSCMQILYIQKIVRQILSTRSLFCIFAIYARRVSCYRSSAVRYVGGWEFAHTSTLCRPSEYDISCLI